MRKRSLAKVFLSEPPRHSWSYDADGPGVNFYDNVTAAVEFALDTHHPSSVLPDEPSETYDVSVVCCSSDYAQRGTQEGVFVVPWERSSEITRHEIISVTYKISQ